MDERKKIILKAIIWEYVKTHEPISSFFLRDNYNLNVSSATIRNEMQELEEMGYLMQPYTSGGRIPTDEAYRFFVNEFKDSPVSKSVQSQIDESLQKIDNNEDLAKEATKVLSNLAKTLAITVIFNKGRFNIYSSGYENLLSQADVWEERILGPFWILDNIEEYIKLINQYLASNKIVVMIGKENPFAILHSSSTIFLGYDINKEKRGAIGIIGPKRMDYRRNISLIQYVRDQYL